MVLERKNLDMQMLEPNLLITDDNRDFRLCLAEALSRRGYRTVLAADGIEALPAYRSRVAGRSYAATRRPRHASISTRNQVDFAMHPDVCQNGRIDCDSSQTAANQSSAFKTIQSESAGRHDSSLA
jgi:CheY-like chemotaxis protein